METETPTIQNPTNAQIEKKISSGEYKLVQRQGRSRVWKFYAGIQNEDGQEIDNIV